MGEKDFQQYHLVKNFLEKKYNTKVIKCKTIRNRNKIALSSRNLLLDKIFLKIVAKVFNEIKTLKKIISKKVNINNSIFKRNKKRVDEKI